MAANTTPRPISRELATDRIGAVVVTRLRARRSLQLSEELVSEVIADAGSSNDPKLKAAADRVRVADVMRFAEYLTRYDH